MISAAPQLGFSITSPFKAVAKGVSSGVKATGHVVATGAKVGVKATTTVVKKVAPVVALAALPAVAVSKLIAEPILKAALTPVRNRVNTLKDRRAKKIAWDKRKSTTPTAAERSEAQSWAKGYLRRQTPPLGLTLSLLAGPPEIKPFGDSDYVVLLGEPASATVAASIPALLALINSILSRTSKSGEAPASIQPGSGGPTPPDAPGTVDMTPVQDAVDDAGDDGGAAPAAPGAKGKHGKGAGAGGISSLIPGGITKTHLMIGGAVIGGAILLAVLTSRRG